MTAKRPAPAPNAVGDPKARVTLNLPASMYRDVERWATDAAATLGKPRVSIQDAMRGMIRAAVLDKSIGVVVIDLLRRDRRGQRRTRSEVNRRLTSSQPEIDLVNEGTPEGPCQADTAYQPSRGETPIETSEYVAMMMRIIIGYGERIGDDPVALTHLRDLEAVTRDAVNAGIYLANRSGERPYSINEIAAIMGISKQAVHKRVQLGEVVYARLEAARASGAVVRLADMRKTRAAILAAAGIPDRTGSPRRSQPDQVRLQRLQVNRRFTSAARARHEQVNTSPGRFHCSLYSCGDYDLPDCGRGPLGRSRDLRSRHLRPTPAALPGTPRTTSHRHRDHRLRARHRPLCMHVGVRAPHHHRLVAIQ